MAFGAAFDLEGTSVNLEPLRHGAHLSAAASFGIHLDYEFAVARLPHFIGGPDEKVASDLYDLSQSTLPMPKEDFIREFLARDTIAFEQSLAQCEIAPREGLCEFLHWLEEHQFRRAIGSLTSRAQATVILQRSGLLGAFASTVVLREDVKALKPAPDVYLATARAMGVSPSMQIVFDDSPRGIEAALRAGSHPIGMPVIHSTAARAALLASRPLSVFTDWRDPALRAFILRLRDALARESAEQRPPSTP